ncbi:hypothetical protein ASD03_34115 [Ensifer sp. Root127]|nr:hypothetical protein ASD03_34115 [Ensifer sp. Root127]
MCGDSQQSRCADAFSPDTVARTELLIMSSSNLDIFRDLENANLGFSVGAETSARSGLDHANSGTAFTWDEIGIEDLKGKMIEARDLLRIGVRTSGM